MGHQGSSTEYYLHPTSYDVWRRSGAKAPRGVVVFIYGGSWQSGRRADYRFAAEALTFVKQYDSFGMKANIPLYGALDNFATVSVQISYGSLRGN